MLHRTRTYAAATAALAIVAASLVSGASAAEAVTTCAPTPALLSRAPLGSFSLPGGASARIWDTGNLARDLSEVRLAVVTVPKDSLTPGVATSRTISAAATPATMVATDPNAVVVINAGHFDATVPGVPIKSELVGGGVRKASSIADRGIAVYPSSKTVHLVESSLTGRVASRRGTWALTRVNWQTLAPSGISTYTYAWGSRAHPYGPRTVVVTRGLVTKILLGSAGSVRPASGQWFLTAPTGSYATALATLRIGDSVTVTPGTRGTLLDDGSYRPRTDIGPVVGLTGAGATLVQNGVTIGPCGLRDEDLRPRSAIAWMPNGDMLVVAVAGRALVNGTRFGGATVHQFGDYLRQLGATWAVNLDGGTSTTLLVRRTVGGPLIRLDRPTSEYQRAVVDALVFRA